MSALQECWEPNDGHTEHISEGSEAPACGHEGSVFEEGCYFLSYGEALRMVFLRHILLLVDEKERNCCDESCHGQTNERRPPPVPGHSGSEDGISNHESEEDSQEREADSKRSSPGGDIIGVGSVHGHEIDSLGDSHEDADDDEEGVRSGRHVGLAQHRGRPGHDGRCPGIPDADAVQYQSRRDVADHGPEAERTREPPELGARQTELSYDLPGGGTDNGPVKVVDQVQHEAEGDYRSGIAIPLLL
mmetsp:Transcript_12382/g.35423  ORF Transcript_12382/g.35423 Transcript_12382/m.35423 type:complete len:246 (+) Transcript_12382:727-1464(+)